LGLLSRNRSPQLRRGHGGVAGPAAKNRGERDPRPSSPRLAIDPVGACPASRGKRVRRGPELQKMESVMEPSCAWTGPAKSGKSDVVRKNPASAGPMVVALVPDRLSPFEFAVACEVFGYDRSEMGVPWYRFAVCSARAGPGPCRRRPVSISPFPTVWELSGGPTSLS